MSAKSASREQIMSVCESHFEKSCVRSEVQTVLRLVWNKPHVYWSILIVGFCLFACLVGIRNSHSRLRKRLENIKYHTKMMYGFVSRVNKLNHTLRLADWIGSELNAYYLPYLRTHAARWKFNNDQRICKIWEGERFPDFFALSTINIIPALLGNLN